MLNLQPRIFTSYSDHTTGLTRARQRVRLGAALLDHKQPDWRKRIDTANLDLEDTRNCIIGQLYGYYINGLEQLRISGGYGHGFYFDHEDLEAFTYAWLEELQRK